MTSLTFYLLVINLCVVKQRGCTALTKAADSEHNAVVDLLLQYQVDAQEASSSFDA